MRKQHGRALAAKHQGAPLARLLGLPRDDQRRTRLVNEDRVHFIDDAKGEGTLEDEVVRLLREVVAQVVEAELRVGDVRDVRRVRLPPRLARHPLHPMYHMVHATPNAANTMVDR